MNTLGQTFAYHASEPPCTLETPPSNGAAPALPDREWSLSARQVVAVVVAIIAACEVLGAVL